MFAENGKLQLRNPQGFETKIVIAGDACPHKSAEDYIKAGHAADILAPIQGVLDDADVRVVQWETPVSSTEAPITKCGPNLLVSPETAEKFLKAGHFDIALMANNHTGDHGPEAVLSTLKLLKEYGIKTVGAGTDDKDAAKALRFVSKGIKFSLINVCEMEFGTALPWKAGSNAMREFAVPFQIAEEKAAGNLVIVVIHGGNEHNPIPSPRMKGLYRSFAKAGAALVMNIHTHCPQGIEVVDGTPIVYCPGNFFFSDMGDFNPADFWWSGYLPKFTFDAAGVVAVEVTPFYFKPDPWQVIPLKGAQRQWYLDYIDQISLLMQTDGDRFYDIWCATRNQSPIWWCSRYEWEKFSKNIEDEEALKNLPPIRHMMTCQSHNELARNIFLLVEQKRINELCAHAKELEDLRVAHFFEK